MQPSLIQFVDSLLLFLQNSKRSLNKEEYHSHHYVNGSNCELVGKARQATVKVVCFVVLNFRLCYQAIYSMIFMKIVQYVTIMFLL